MYVYDRYESHVYIHSIRLFECNKQLKQIFKALHIYLYNMLPIIDNPSLTRCSSSPNNNHNNYHDGSSMRLEETSQPPSLIRSFLSFRRSSPTTSPHRSLMSSPKVGETTIPNCDSLILPQATSSIFKEENFHLQNIRRVKSLSPCKLRNVEAMNAGLIIDGDNRLNQSYDVPDQQFSRFNSFKLSIGIGGGKGNASNDSSPCPSPQNATVAASSYNPGKLRRKDVNQDKKNATFTAIREAKLVDREYHNFYGALSRTKEAMMERKKNKSSSSSFDSRQDRDDDCENKCNGWKEFEESFYGSGSDKNIKNISEILPLNQEEMTMIALEALSVPENHRSAIRKMTRDLKRYENSGCLHNSTYKIRKAEELSSWIEERMEMSKALESCLKCIRCEVLVNAKMKARILSDIVKEESEVFRFLRKIDRREQKYMMDLFISEGIIDDKGEEIFDDEDEEDDDSMLSPFSDVES